MNIHTDEQLRQLCLAATTAKTPTEAERTLKELRAAIAERAKQERATRN